MARNLLLALLLMPIMSRAQQTEKAMTVIYKDGATRSFRLTNYKDVADPHHFILTDASTGERIIVIPEETEVVLLQGAEAWIPAIVELDQSPDEISLGELSAGATAYPPRTDTVFLLNEFKGKTVALYSVRIGKRQHIFLSKRNGPYQELIHKRILLEGRAGNLQQDHNPYQAVLADAVSKCPMMASATPTVAFDAGSIARFLQTFEMDCLKNAETKLRSEIPDKPLIFSIMVGSTWNRPSFASDNPNELIPPGPVSIAGTPSFGLSLMVPTSAGRHGFSVGIEMYFNRFRAHADTVWLKGGTPELHRSRGLDYSISSIRSALVGQYKFYATPKLRPFLKGGLNIGYAVSSYASSATYVYQSGTLQESTFKDPFKAQGFNPFQLGFTLGAGMDISHFSIQYKFETSAGYVSTVNTGSSLLVHSLFLSYAF